MSLGIGNTVSNKDFTQVELVVVSGKTVNSGEIAMINSANRQVQSFEGGLAGTFKFFGIFNGASVLGNGTKKAWVDISGGVKSSFTTSAGTADLGKACTVATSTTIEVEGTGPECGIVTPELDCFFTSWNDTETGFLNEKFYLKTDHLNASAGAGSAGKPIVLDAGGMIDTTMLDDVYLKTAHLNASAGAGDAGKPIVLDAGGQIDLTMVEKATIEEEIILANFDAGVLVADDELHFKLPEGCVLKEISTYINRATDGATAIEITATCEGDALAGGTLDITGTVAIGTRTSLSLTTNTTRTAGDTLKLVLAGTVHIAGQISVGFVLQKTRAKTN